MISLPERRPLSDVSSLCGGKVDVFVSCSSFEDRCLSIAGQFDSSNVETAVIAKNVNEPESEKNAGTLLERFGDRAIRADLRTDNPIMSADSLRKALDGADIFRKRAVVVDITTFTHEHLLILIGLLRAKMETRPTLVYTGASEYMIGEKWLSRGICGIRSVLGFPGDLQPARDVHLIVLVGFELERVERLVDSYEPSVVSLGYSTRTESIAEKHAETNRGFHRRLCARLKNVHEFTFPCRSAIGTAESISNEVRRFSRMATVVAPLNTKVSTVGAAIAAFGDPAMQLCYAQAEEYNYSGYSKPSDTFYVVECQKLWRT